MLSVILLVVFWFLIGWTSAITQNLERNIPLIGQGQTSDHLIFNMCLIDRWDYMMAVGMLIFYLIFNFCNKAWLPFNFSSFGISQSFVRLRNM